ncbi:MAG: class I SAM-dependent methyltransferase [Planctomycetota bacterium]|jgi:hypothetical protein
MIKVMVKIIPIIICVLLIITSNVLAYDDSNLRVPIDSNIRQREIQEIGQLSNYLLRQISKGHESEVETCLAFLKSGKDVFLEIGAGNGKASWLIAGENPNVNVIATDQFNVHTEEHSDAREYNENRIRYESFTLDCQTSPLDNFVITRANDDIIETLPSESVTYLLVVNPAMGLEEDLIANLDSLRKILKPEGRIIIIPHYFSDKWMEDATYVKNAQFYIIKGFELVIDSDPTFLGVDLSGGSGWTSSGRVLRLTKKTDIFSDIALLKQRDQLLSENLRLILVNAIAKILGFEDDTEVQTGSYATHRLYEIFSKTKARLIQYETIFNPAEYAKINETLEECRLLFAKKSPQALRKLIGIAEQVELVTEEDISTELLRLLGFTNNTYERQAYLEKEIKKPLSITRDGDDIKPGDLLSIYEVLKRDFGNAKNLWRRLGLETEFREMFPDERSFWQTDKSLLEIYIELKSKKESAATNASRELREKL